MKKNLDQESGQENTGILEKLTSNEATILLAFLVATITLLDFYSHPNSGLADPQRREALINIFGPVIKSIGNYGFSASLAMSAVVAKNIFKKLFHSEVIQKIIKYGYMFSIASLFTLNALIEDFPGNNEPGPDFAMGSLGVVMGALLAELCAYKIKRAFNNSND